MSGIKKVGKQYAVSVIAEYVGVKLFQIKTKRRFLFKFQSRDRTWWIKSYFMVHDIKFWTHVIDEKAYACERYSPEKEQGRRSLEATPLLS